MEGGIVGGMKRFLVNLVLLSALGAFAAADTRASHTAPGRPALLSLSELEQTFPDEDEELVNALLESLSVEQLGVVESDAVPESSLFHLVRNAGKYKAPPGTRYAVYSVRNEGKQPVILHCNCIPFSGWFVMCLINGSLRLDSGECCYIYILPPEDEAKLLSLSIDSADISADLPLSPDMEAPLLQWGEPVPASSENLSLSVRVDKNCPYSEELGIPLSVSITNTSDCLVALPLPREVADDGVDIFNDKGEKVGSCELSFIFCGILEQKKLPLVLMPGETVVTSFSSMLCLRIPEQSGGVLMVFPTHKELAGQRLHAVWRVYDLVSTEFEIEPLTE